MDSSPVKSAIFESDKSVELDRNSVVAFFATIAADGFRATGGRVRNLRFNRVEEWGGGGKISASADRFAME